MQRKASAIWQGGLKDGKGNISTDSGVLKKRNIHSLRALKTAKAPIQKSF